MKDPKAEIDMCNMRHKMTILTDLPENYLQQFYTHLGPLSIDPASIYLFRFNN